MTFADIVECSANVRSCDTYRGQALTWLGVGLVLVVVALLFWRWTRS